MVTETDSGSAAPEACARLQPLLEPYHDAALEPDQHAEVARHLSECPACAADVAGLEALRDVLRRPVQTELETQPAADMWERVAGALELTAPPQRTPAVLPFPARRAWTAYTRPALAAAAVVAFAVLALVAKPPAPERVEVAHDMFVIEDIETGGDGVMVYEADDSGMTIIWVIEHHDTEPQTEEPLA